MNIYSLDVVGKSSLLLVLFFPTDIMYTTLFEKIQLKFKRGIQKAGYILPYGGFGY